MMDLLDNIQGLGLCLVTKESEFIRMNKLCMEMTGFKNQSSLEGKSYIHMPCKASESFEDFIFQDQETLKKNQNLKILAVQKYVDDWKIIFAEKFILRDENAELTGIFTILRDVKDKFFSDACLFLTQFDLASIDFKNKKQANYILDSQPHNAECSPREKEILFYLIRGKTAKEIALILGISFRTVENHIENIKIKFSCRNKSQLIEKARNGNYFSMLPMSLLNNKLRL